MMKVAVVLMVCFTWHFALATDYTVEDKGQHSSASTSAPEELEFLNQIQKKSGRR